MPDTAVPFGASLGYSDVNTQDIRRVELQAVDEGRIDQLKAEAESKTYDYEIVSGIGMIPKRYLAGIARMEEFLITDMPFEDWDLQLANIDSSRVRREQTEQLRRGDLTIRTIALHRQSDTVVADSSISVPAASEAWARHGNTVVDSRHRGHRLGLLVKIANQRLLKSYRPHMKYVITGNATVNDHMIAINEAIGYRLYGKMGVFQKKHE
ncbi:hypothetical protein [Haloglycomyces albus]|uniref:hypothetical protein n=1 Tax=Haloglycomyces albus TaxID=526067 RepID=UPI00046D5D68|nr:hypothetical protein [Haloglycomyces albus]